MSKNNYLPYTLYSAIKNNLHQFVFFIFHTQILFRLSFCRFSLFFISHIARYAPSSKKENQLKIQTKTKARYFFTSHNDCFCLPIEFFVVPLARKGFTT